MAPEPFFSERVPLTFARRPSSPLAAALSIPRPSGAVVVRVGPGWEVRGQRLEEAPRSPRPSRPPRPPLLCASVLQGVPTGAPERPQRVCSVQILEQEGQFLVSRWGRGPARVATILRSWLLCPCSPESTRVRSTAKSGTLSSVSVKGLGEGVAWLVRQMKWEGSSVREACLARRKEGKLVRI